VKSFNKTKEGCFVGSYSRTNVKEFFAESFASYYLYFPICTQLELLFLELNL